VSDRPETTDHNQEWLAKSQALITNLRYWVSHGRCEAALSEIDDYWRRWREACDAKRS